MKVVTCVMLIGLVSGLSAQQQRVVPVHFRDAEGNLGLSSGLGNGAHQNRFLQLLDYGAFRNITKVALRRDGVANSTYPASALVADIYMSSATTNFNNLSPVFANNHGADKKQVANLGVFMFPQTEPGPVPDNWSYQFPFDVPYLANGSQNRLCLEFITHYRTSTRQVVFDAAGNWDDNPPAVIRNFGSGCYAAGQSQPVTLRGSATTMWPQQTADVGYIGTGLPPGGTAVLALGADATSMGGLPLPYTLPGTVFGGSSGPCTILNDWAVTAPLPVDASGTVSISQSIVVRVTPNGTSMFGQLIGLDPAANPYGIVLSNSSQIHFVRPFGSTQLISHSYVEGSHSAIGTPVLYQGVVVEF